MERPWLSFFADERERLFGRAWVGVDDGSEHGRPGTPPNPTRPAIERSDP
jgi:hypothetical protein